MKKDYTDITVLVDRSGSMSTIRSDMEGGFNSFLEKQREDTTECTISLYTFDGGWHSGSEPRGSSYRSLNLETKYIAHDIQTAPQLVLDPCGCTPLWDAIGQVVGDTGVRLRGMSEKDRPERVIFVIITDGLENASRKFKGPQIKEMLEKQRDQYNWCFIYMGANQDAIEVGEDLGVFAESSLTYKASNKGVNAMASGLACGVASARSCSLQDYKQVVTGKVGFFSQENRDEAVEKTY